MPLSTLTDVLLHARERNCGVPNIWGGSVEKILGYVHAAEEMAAPLSLCYNHALCPEIPLDYGFSIIVAAAKRAKVPIAVILDHGESLEECVAAIMAGATGVMYDGSHLPYRENLERTREVVRVAHAADVSVEAELGAVGGSALEYGGTTDLESVLTEPDQAVDFVDSTGVDALAISVGNSHGLYKGPAHIRHDLIQEIARRVEIPLVMHGASGLPKEEYRRIIDSGITKINYHSAMSVEAMERLRAYVDGQPPNTPCHNVIRHMIGVYTDETRSLLRLLGWGQGASTGRPSEDPVAAGRAGADAVDVDEIAAMVVKVLEEQRSQEERGNRYTW